jgi:hypothetical protein
MLIPTSPAGKGQYVVFRGIYGSGKGEGGNNELQIYVVVDHRL